MDNDDVLIDVVIWFDADLDGMIGLFVILWKWFELVLLNIDD